MKTAMKFVKKQVIVEAIQFNGNSNKGDIELFVGKELKAELESETAYVAGQGAPIFSLLIETKEGVMKAFKNDWIIKEPFPTGDRDFYPCKPDIFGKTYLPYASHPSPMSADDWQIIALDEDGTQHQVKHENGSAFTGNYQQCLSFYELVSGKSPMSAEQVEELADKYASEEFDKHSFSEFKGAENSLWENRKADFIAGYNAATTPSVKADGWVIPDNVTLKDIKAVRDYFGEHDKSPFEHRAFDVMNKLVDYFTPHQNNNYKQ